MKRAFSAPATASSTNKAAKIEGKTLNTKVTKATKVVEGDETDDSTELCCVCDAVRDIEDMDQCDACGAPACTDGCLAECLSKSCAVHGNHTVCPECSKNPNCPCSQDGKKKSEPAAGDQKSGDQKSGDGQVQAAGEPDPSLLKFEFGGSNGMTHFMLEFKACPKDAQEAATITRLVQDRVKWIDDDLQRIAREFHLPTTDGKNTKVAKVN